MILVAFGGGTNSTAMLVGLHERGERPDLILFSDTGGEKPHTYQHVEEVSAWCERVGFPAIQSVRAANTTLEADCLRRKTLPSIVFGFKTCSQRFKGEPQEKFVNNWPPAREVWARGEKVSKLVGYDAGEERRVRPYDDPKYANRYPLIEWQWDREECIAAIARAGLAQPGKSACFFCPSSKKDEIHDLQRRYPDLMERALAMEDNAETSSVEGLGRNFSWRIFLHGDPRQTHLFPPDIACECYEG